jgi:hypothetical protein
MYRLGSEPSPCGIAVAPTRDGVGCQTSRMASPRDIVIILPFYRLILPFYQDGQYSARIDLSRFSEKSIDSDMTTALISRKTRAIRRS